MSKQEIKMEECVMCCTNPSNCNLICGHSFCRDCVKTWYLKCKLEPTCPNCRHKLYFKGMYKMTDTWEEEAETMKNEDAFNEAFDYILEFVDSDSEFDSDSDSSGYESDTPWNSDLESDDGDNDADTEEPVRDNNQARDEYDELASGPIVSFEDFYSDNVIADLIELQKRYHLALKYNLDMPEVLESDWFWETCVYGNSHYYVPDDIFPHTKKLFISNHKNTNNKKRTSKRIPHKHDASSTLVFYIELV